MLKLRINEIDIMSSCTSTDIRTKIQLLVQYYNLKLPMLLPPPPPPF